MNVYGHWPQNIIRDRELDLVCMLLELLYGQVGVSTGDDNVRFERQGEH